MRQAVQALRIKVNGRDLPPVSVSIGIARLPADAPTLEQVLKRADQALYAAKQNGRNRVCMAEGTPETGLSSH
jgi:diguanylate cyclase (GGDEF)-like protein